MCSCLFLDPANIDITAPIILDAPDSFTVTWTATDFAGNSAMCEATVRVKCK